MAARFRSVALSIAALALASAALTFGTGQALADPNDPSPTELTPEFLRSEPSASISGGDLCVANMGTMPGSEVRTSEQGVPNQMVEEAGPEWVGSRGWQAVGINPADPWGGSFDPRNAATGPACSPVSANGF